MRKLLSLFVLAIIFLFSAESTNAQVNISDPISVTDNDESFGRKSPKLAVNASGQVMVFWMRTGNEAFFISTLGDDGFTDPVNIPFGDLNPNLWSGSLGPNMAAYGDHVYVTFEVYGEAIYVVHSADAGQSWTDPVAAFTPPEDRKATIPVVAVDGDGNPYIAYVNTNNSEADAYYGLVRSEDQGLTFLPEVLVSAESAGNEVCECCNGHIDVADNGDVYVAFRNNESNLRDIWLARSTDGGDSFSTAFDVDETDWTAMVCPSNGPHFVIQDNEVVTTFYSGTGTAGTSSYFSTFDSENSIEGPTYNLPLSDESSAGQNRPRVAGANDTLAVVWQEIYDGSIEIGMTVSTIGSAGLSTDPFLLGDFPAHQQYPSIVYSNGAFHIVYEDSDSGTVVYQSVDFNTVGFVESAQSIFKMGPNPADKTLFIQLEEPSIVSLKICDATGRSVYSKIVSSDNLHIDVSSFPSGVYLVSVDNGIAQKLVIR